MHEPRGNALPAFHRLLIHRGWMFACALVLAGCYAPEDDRHGIDRVDYVVQQTWQIDGLSMQEIVQFEEVFWEPDDTISLRQMIIDEGIVSGRKVLEIGTGTGLLAILCAQNGAVQVVATDINPTAIANARYNAAMQEVTNEIEFRKVSKSDPSAYAVLKPEERFDVLISNPPWELGQPQRDLDHAYYDPGFALMDSLLDGLPERLNPGGRCLLVYGNVDAIRRLLEEAEKRGHRAKIHDDRELEQLPTNFLPGMLVEITPQPAKGG